MRGPHGCLGDRGELGAGHGGGGQILGRAMGKGGGQLRAEAADRGGAQEYLLPVQTHVLRAAAHVHCQETAKTEELRMQRALRRAYQMGRVI